MILQASTATLVQRVTASTATVTLHLTDGTDLTGTATVSPDGRIITLTAGATVWTVPGESLLAVGRPA